MSARPPRRVVVPTGVTVRELSIALQQPMPDLIKALMAAGVMRTAHESLTDNEVGVVAAALGREISVSDRE